MTSQDGDAGIYSVAIVSCDIIGHSSVRENHLQRDRVLAINRIVAESIQGGPPDGVIWASGGDGGHVVFRHDGWQQPALELVIRLRLWSLKQDIPLRITAHYGQVSHVIGADGRTQVVGDGINYSGWLLTRATAFGIIASEDFQRAFGDASNPDESDLVGIRVQFRHRRTLRHGRLSTQRLWLMSMIDPGNPELEDQSAWEPPIEEEHDQLNLALNEKSGWDVLFFAKRILQINTADEDATRALNRLESHTLRYREQNKHLTPNPFFRYLNSDSLREVVQAGQLVERRYNDIICRFGDAGDTMFVILRGQVGVYRPEGVEADAPTEPSFVHQEGEIVGELAFALARNRTADLVALTDVALLSFNYSHISNVLSASPTGHQTIQQISNFIDYRVLEHVAHRADYLLGPDRNGPLAVGKPWQDTLRELRPYCRLISVSASRLRFESTDLFINRKTPVGLGLCILVAGELSSDPRHLQADASKRLSGEQFPVLWVDLPDLYALPQASYGTLSESLKVFHIRAEGVAQLQPTKRQALQETLTRMHAPKAGKPPRTSEHEYDIFLCYSTRDAALVTDIAHELKEAGVRCWLDVQQIEAGHSIIQRIEDGLSKSRFVVPCISKNFTGSNWAKAEYTAVLNSEITQGSSERIIPLLLDDQTTRAPGLLADKKSVAYTDRNEFSAFIKKVKKDQR